MSPAEPPLGIALLARPPTLLIDGEVLPGFLPIVSASVSRELGRIPTALVELRADEAGGPVGPVANMDDLVPGRQIEVRFGYGDEPETVFAGIIVKNRIKVRDGHTLVSVECCDNAVRMTRGRHSRSFTDATDSEVLAQIIEPYGLGPSVTPMPVRHRQLVQYDATDWDFLVARADANGCVVVVHDGTITVEPPQVASQPVAAVTFGTTLIELDAEVDAYSQVEGVVAASWDPTGQEVLVTRATEPPLTQSGNLSVDALSEVAGGAEQRLRHGGALGEPELQEWANGRLLMARLAKVRGRARFPGFAGVLPGNVVEIEGIGDRFAGTHLVAAVHHTLGTGGWETEVAFGLDPDSDGHGHSVAATRAGGLLPSVTGLQVGVVTGVADPDGLERIRVQLPVHGDAGGDGIMARLATLDAGDGRGTFFRPDIGDEVVVGFLADDPRHPVVLGQLHSAANPAPEPGEDDNGIKGYVSRTGLRVRYDDDTGAIVFDTPAGNRITLSDGEELIELVDQHGNSIALTSDGIAVNSAKDLTIAVSGVLDVRAERILASADLLMQTHAGILAEVTAGSNLVLRAGQVEIN